MIIPTNSYNSILPDEKSVVYQEMLLKLGLIDKIEVIENNDIDENIVHKKKNIISTSDM